jgi:hypothetical protein
VLVLKDLTHKDMWNAECVLVPHTSFAFHAPIIPRFDNLNWLQKSHSCIREEFNDGSIDWNYFNSFVSHATFTCNHATDAVDITMVLRAEKQRTAGYWAISC